MEFGSLGYLYSFLVNLILVLGIIAVISYLAPLIYVLMWKKRVDFKKQYGDQWAMVTGASSGLGKEICKFLLRQHVRGIVMVALDDSLFQSTVVELTEEFPYAQIRKVACDLSDYETRKQIDEIIQATADIPVGYVFSNAGYAFDQLLSDVDEHTLRKHIECLATSSIVLTNHFYSRMVRENRNGAIVFTSSMASFYPASLCATYSACKGMISAHTSVLAVEASDYGIDVLCAQPGYIETPFQDNLKGMKLLDQVKFMSQTSTKVVDHIFRAIGTLYYLDTGVMSWLTHIFLTVVGQNGVVWSQAVMRDWMPDYANHKRESESQAMRVNKKQL